MVGSHISHVKDRLAVLLRRRLTLSGCTNILSTPSKQEGKEISQLPEVQLVPTGTAAIVQQSRARPRFARS